MKPVLVLLMALVACAAQQNPIPIWPGNPPGSESWNWEETPFQGQDGITRISNVTRPVIIPYLPERAAANGTAVVICPGGGFRWLAIEHEGVQVARYLNSIGVAAFILKYRLVRTGDAGEKDTAVMSERRKVAVPLAVADGLQALRVVRKRAAEWGLVADRIGIIGFSAGGYVAAAAAFQYDASSRPDFAAPIYPATPNEITVPANAPPLFLAHADDDKTVPTPKTSLRLYQAWRDANLPVELHIYSKGGHGFGMKKAGLPVDSWADRFRDWLSVQGLLKRP